MYTSMRLTPASGVTRHFRIWERGGKGQLSTNEVWRHAPYADELGAILRPFLGPAN